MADTLSKVLKLHSNNNNNKTSSHTIQTRDSVEKEFKFLHDQELEMRRSVGKSLLNSEQHKSTKTEAKKNSKE